MPPRDGHRTSPRGPGWSCDPAAGGRDGPQARHCLGTAPYRQLLRCRKRLWSQTDMAQELWCRSANQRSASCKSLILKENTCCKLNKRDLRLMRQALSCSPQPSRKKLPSQVAFLLILYTVIYVIVWIHFLFKLWQVSKYCDFGFLYYLPRKNPESSFTIIYELSLKNAYGKKVQSTKYTGKKLETHFLTGMAGFEFMRDFFLPC